MEVRKKPRKKHRLTVLVLFGLLILLVGVRGPYLFPTSLALGPCFPDFVSPSTYLALFEAPASPMKRLNFSVGTADVQICYGSPSARNRRVFEESSAVDTDSTITTEPSLIPNGRLWRLGANEPTRLFTNEPILFGSLRLEAGRYAIYALPGPANWEIFVTRSINHWGNQISSGVRSKEIGSTIIPFAYSDSFSESLQMHANTVLTDSTALEIVWESRALTIPIMSLK